MPTDHGPNEELCMLCQVNPVDPGKKVCTACWQLAPSWVKKTFMKGERVDWARLLEPNSNSPMTIKQEDERAARDRR